MDHFGADAEIARVARAALSGLTDDEFRSIERFLRCFRVPRVDHAWVVLRAIHRLFATVPWASELGGLAELADLLRRIGPQVEHLYRVSGASGLAAELRGDFIESSTLIESVHVTGADALSLALVACSWSWDSSDQSRSTARVALGRTIRVLDKVPIEGQKVLLAIRKAATIDEFLRVAKGLVVLGRPDLSEQWELNFEPTLRELSRQSAALDSGVDASPGPVPPDGVPDPRGGGSRKGGAQPKARTRDADALIDKLVDSIRRVRGPRPSGIEEPAIGESPQELDLPLLTAAVPERPANKDARSVLSRQIRQAIWSSNHLLLPEHSAVLRWPDYVRVVRRLMADLSESGQDPTVQGVRVVVLLHALTGRTVRALQSMEIAAAGSEASGHNPQILLDEGAIRMFCFWQISDGSSDAPNYFTPDERQRVFVEDVRPDFLALLVPSFLKVLSANAKALGDCLRWKTDDLAQAMRDCASDISEREGFEFTIGQLRASFSVHLFEQCRDLATTQLIAADTLGQSTAPLAYYAPRARDIAACFWSFQCRALGEAVPMPAYPLGQARIGSHLLATPSTVKRLARQPTNVIRHGVSRLISESRLSDLHDAITTHTVCMLIAVATHRPSEALFELTIGDFLIDRDQGVGLFRDKVHDGAHDPRLVALPKTVARQLQAYLTHLAGLAAHESDLADHVQRVLTGKAPLFFRVTPGGGCLAMDLASFKERLPKAWRVLPLNWGRHWTRTYAIEMGIRPELVNMQLGHLEAVGYPFSGASPTEPWRFVEVVAPEWDRLAKMQGWEVFHGIKADLPEALLLPPLRKWGAHIESHLGLQRKAALMWESALRAKLRGYRETAMKQVLEHPELTAAGITAIFSEAKGSFESHSLDRADFERIRDEVFSSAGDDLALAMARADAVCRIARVVNRRTGQSGSNPGSIFTLRRPLDNAFVPNMMIAVRQVDALRRHVASLVAEKAKDRDWDLEIACAHAVLALCLFGYCESVEQAIGALENRGHRIRSRVLPDVVLVPYGSGVHEVLGLRGVAANVIARLAKKFPGSVSPSRDQIDAAVTRLLPNWAIANPSAKKGGGCLESLFETCAVANRYELSPAARLANAVKGGSTAAHIQEQVALIDGDPAGVLRRSWEVAESASTSSVRPRPVAGRKANARTQYEALCAVFPGSGDTALPVTGRLIPSNDSNSPQSRRFILDELQARLGQSGQNEALQPIVRVLTEWTIDMLENGTLLKSNPSLSTVETYLTRIGGILVHVFGQYSLEFVDEADLEEAYLAAIEGPPNAKTDPRSEVASTVLSFHAFAQARAGFPEIDLSEVRLYLRKTKEPLADARLVLPSERTAAIEKVERLASTPEGHSADEARVYRQAVYGLGLMAFSGLRRSEPLGVQLRDVTTDGSEVIVRIRPNHARRVKTQNARRVIRMRTDAIRVHGAHLGQWVETERNRIGRRRLERAFVFSPVDAPFSMEQGAKVAKVCLDALREATGRPDQRLHALRHLVGMEQLTSPFLTPEDRVALAETLPVREVPTLRDDLALPRDLQAQVIPLGHGNPRTTIRHYHHLPWLLRSRSDARLSAQYVNRATLAPLLGVTLHAMDFAVKKRPDRPRGLVWLDIAVSVRPRPSLPRRSNRGIDAAVAASKESKSCFVWTAVELSKVLEEVARVGDLEQVLRARGAPIEEAALLRRRFAAIERRLGRRLLVEVGRPGGSGAPRRELRSMKAAAPFETFLSWFDKDEEGRRSILVSIANDLFEHLHAKQGDQIVLSPDACQQLLALLEKVGFAAPAILVESDDDGFCTLRVLRSTGKRAAEAGGSSGQYLGLALKRLLLLIRVCSRSGVASAG